MAHHSTWGPSGLIVEQVVRRAATLTDEELTILQKAWEAGEDDGYDEAWGRVGYVAAKTGRDPLRAGVDARDVSGYRAARPVRDAATAAAVSDLVGQYGLTREHVDALLGPWLQVVGDPRVDPVCQCEGAAVTIDLGALAPQPGDVCPWLVMAADSPEPLMVGYATTGEDAIALADQVDGPAILWRAGKETP